MSKAANPFRYFNSSREVIRLVVMMYIRFPLSLRNVEDLLFERGIDICHATVRHWWNRFGPKFAAHIRHQRISRMRGFRQWRWHLDEIYVKLKGEMVYRKRCFSHGDPGHEFADTVGRMTVGEPGEPLGQVSVRVDGIELATLDERSDHRPVVAAFVRTGEERVFAI